MGEARSGRWWKDHVVLLASAAVVTFAAGVGAAVGVSRALNSSATPAPPRPHLQTPISGSVAQIKNSSVGTSLSLKVSGDGRAQVPIGSTTRITSVDGSKLAASSLRPGDAVSISKRGDVDDQSQKHSSLHGIVATSPVDLASPMIVQVAGLKDIVVDLEPSTEIRSTKNRAVPATLVSTADPVTLEGVLDSRLGEMTETTLMVVTQPVRKPAH